VGEVEAECFKQQLHRLLLSGGGTAQTFIPLNLQEITLHGGGKMM